jgi:2-polyprenyl-6-methoxyphenol hydroxylase-like FAD-dependent oxidoreductase
MKKIQSIIIVGGGTSGWLTAAYLTRNLRIPAKITLIEDVSAGPIGVGEGTQPLTAKFLYQCGLKAKDWMKPAQAAFKHGVEMVGWTDDTYFVDNDVNTNCMIAEDIYTSDYFLDKTVAERNAWHPAYRLAQANLSPKFHEHLDANPGVGPESYGAVHFSAMEIIESIKNLIVDRISHVDARISTVNQDHLGIKNLIDYKGQTYTADLYIDCTGFSSQLLEVAMKSPWTSYQDYLPVDRAVVLPTEYSDPETECHPYTRATTMTAGWRFTIPILTRVGNGYIYSSRHISDEAAEAELRAAIGRQDGTVKFLHMKCGTHKEVSRKNVVAVGLAAGFIEPLEATGITFTTAAVQNLTELLNYNNMLWNDWARGEYNTAFNEMVTEILAFVWSHYHWSTRNDTPFWQEVRSQEIEELPPGVQAILALFLPTPRRFLFASRTSMFNVWQWFCVLHAGGAYGDQVTQLSPEQTTYTEYVLDSTRYRTDRACDMLKNHYRYLKAWYGS